MSRASDTLPLYADPRLTANIYCAGLLDRVIQEVVVPFWREIRQHDLDQAAYLWVMRYGKGGEHLKVRLHGPEELEPLARRLLSERAESFLASLGDPAEPPLKKGWAGAPPIDDIDDTQTDHPDRTFRWTTYGRSHVSLGGKPFLLDDRYRALMTRCLAQGCEMVLPLETGPDGLFPHRLRQSTLLKALIGGFAALGFSPEARAEYLPYHRDWLLRFILPKDRRSEVEPVQQLLQVFQARLAGMAPAVTSLRQAALAQWRQGGETRTGAAGADAAWRRSLADLLEYIRPFCSDPDYQLDPFATDPAFSPIFKVFHGLANQLGLNLVDEGFAHHFLLAAATGTGDAPGGEATS
jgi:hypothetical protein